MDNLFFILNKIIKLAPDLVPYTKINSGWKKPLA